MFIILNKSQKYFTKRQEELGNLNGYIEEVYSGLNVVKTCNGIDESTKEFDKLNKRLYTCNRKSQFLSGLMQPIMGFVGNFGYVAVCVVGSLLVSKDIISFGINVNIDILSKQWNITPAKVKEYISKYIPCLKNLIN